MKNLLNWELTQTFKTIFIFAVIIVCTLVTLLPMLESGGAKTGYEMFIGGCSDIFSFLILAGSVFTGIHVSGAFEKRKIQAAVMAGNSRLKVLLAKFISYSAAFAAFYIIPLVVGTAAGAAAHGMGETDGSFLTSVILRGAVHMLTMISIFSICFAISVFMKNPGVSIAVNLGVALLLDSLGEYLITQKWAEGFVDYTPVGQIFIVLVKPGVGNLVMAAAVAAATIGISLFVAYMKLGREELK